MSKPLDYYAGYPSQQRLPKWVGVTLGSLFGGLTIVMMAVAIRIVLPARTAEASVVPKVEPAATAPVAQPDSEPAVAAADEVAQPRATAPHAAKHSGHHMAKGKHAGRVAMASRQPAPVNPRYKKAQLFAKSVSSGRRDKKARDDLDKLLGI